MNRNSSPLVVHCRQFSQADKNRRRFLRLGAMAALAGMFPHNAFCSVAALQQPDRTLAFYNTHTGERSKTIYWVEGKYLPESLGEIDHILRDFRTNEVSNIDTILLDLLFALPNELDTNQPFHIISGYRSAQTNALLRAYSSGIAENSLHLVGKAIDIRIPGRQLGALRKAAIALQGGGVGYYPKSGFVHIDVGRVRHW